MLHFGTKGEGRGSVKENNSYIEPIFEMEVGQYRDFDAV
jgi:hypothetical protein